MEAIARGDTTLERIEHDMDPDEREAVDEYFFERLIRHQPGDSRSHLSSRNYPQYRPSNELRGTLLTRHEVKPRCNSRVDRHEDEACAYCCFHLHAKSIPEDGNEEITHAHGQKPRQA